VTDGGDDRREEQDAASETRTRAPWQATVVTLFPDMFPGPLAVSLVGTALQDKIWSLTTIDLRTFGHGRHRVVDDTPAGGGPGMVLKADVVAAAIDQARATAPDRPAIYLSPRGRPLDQSTVRSLSTGPGVVLLAGRFEGVDERVIESRGLEEISIGDYVLSGGELPAMVLIDACVRLLPGVIGASDSLSEESFEAGLLEYPQYTRPRQSGRAARSLRYAAVRRPRPDRRLAARRGATAHGGAPARSARAVNHVRRRAVKGLKKIAAVDKPDGFVLSTAPSSIPKRNDSRAKRLPARSRTRAGALAVAHSFKSKATDHATSSRRSRPSRWPRSAAKRIVPEFGPLATPSSVNVKVIEGEGEKRSVRVQAYEGVVIAQERAPASTRASPSARFPTARASSASSRCTRPMIAEPRRAPPRQGPPRQALLPARPCAAKSARIVERADARAKRLNAAFKGFKKPKGQPDDLKQIKSISADLEVQLRKLNVLKFDQIANFSDEDIANVDEALNLNGRIEKEDWVGQARALLTEAPAETPAA
jgi:tRNA (guanine37-N1)-methyltransferase